MPEEPAAGHPAGAGTPRAEVVIDEALVRSLLEDQHDDLSELPLEPLASGWDNAMYRLGERHVVRLPRRDMAATLIENEQTFLARLADQLTLPAPLVERRGAPGRGYPWRWSILPWIEGEPADQAAVAESQTEVVAGFLRALHTPADPDAPANQYRGVPLSERAAAVEERMERLAGVTDLMKAPLRTAWEDAVSARWYGEPLWLHGDFHPRNILVRDGEITGVIDWGDITSGDPATDLASLWMLFAEARARRRALAVYGADEELEVRARGWAIFFGVVLLDTGLVDDERFVRVGDQTLGRVLEDVG